MIFIKKYEDYNPNTRLDELKKLLSHLANIFNELGYSSDINFDDEYQYSVSLYKKGPLPKWPYGPDKSFELKGDFSTSKIFLSVIERIDSVYDDLVKFIPRYLKSIDGLKLDSEQRDFFQTGFEVVDNVDNIIIQISKEDIESKFQATKYNL